MGTYVRIHHGASNPRSQCRDRAEAGSRHRSSDQSAHGGAGGNDPDLASARHPGRHGSAAINRGGGERHDLWQPEKSAYAYLLGVYLGDGWLSSSRQSWCLSIALDTAYPGIIESCRTAIGTVNGGRSPWVIPDPGGKNCVRIGSGWKRWPCLFPQHGPGRKHHRNIELAGWQRDIAEARPGALLGGLIHSDGWRGLNRVYVKGRWYEYPRYQFSNRSDDIRRIFTDTCDLIGVRWRRWGRYHISVARRESVAKLDEFVGPKA